MTTPYQPMLTIIFTVHMIVISRFHSLQFIREFSRNTSTMLYCFVYLLHRPRIIAVQHAAPHAVMNYHRSKSVSAFRESINKH